MKQLLVGVAAAGMLCAAVPAAHAQAGADALMPANVSASSTLKGKKDKYAAWRAVDFDAMSAGDPSEGGGTYYTTGWCEGKKDQGVGESLSIAGDDVSFTQLSIAAGFWKSDALFKKNNRPTKLTIEVTGHDGQTRSFDLDVPTDMTEAVLDAGEVVDAQDIKITFAAVAKGKVNDTCISNVTIVNGENVRRPFLSFASAVQDLQTAMASLAAAFTDCNDDALTTYVKYPLSYKSLGDPTGEFKQVKKKWKKEKDLAKSCKKGEVPGFGDEVDFNWLESEGPDKVMYRYAGNEMGAAWLHFTYVLSDDAMSGTWKLTSADITTP